MIDARTALQYSSCRVVLGMSDDVLCYAVKGIRVIMEKNTCDSGGD